MPYVPCEMRHLLDTPMVRLNIEEFGRRLRSRQITSVDIVDDCLRQIEAENPSAIRLLHLLAFLSPDGIPRRLLTQSLVHLPDDLSMTVADHLTMDRAVGSLA